MHTRAPKQLGDFGEGLVTYALIRKSFEVAYVDHVGADLIAHRGTHKLAVSVKTRSFKAGSPESRIIEIDLDHIEKLKYFAQRFDLDPVFAQVVSIVDDKIIHLFIIRIQDISKLLADGVINKSKYGYTLGFSKKRLPSLTTNPYVDYSSWSNESIGSKLFGPVVEPPVLVKHLPLAAR